MFLDARTIPSGTAIEADLCIVGGGAAGITIAREFASSRLRVVLLDGGGMEIDGDSQELYAGRSVGRPYLDLTTCRLRYFGGTTNHWGGWCLPLDPIDFEAREGLPHSGWPFGRSELDPFYRRAQPIMQLGPYDYRLASWGVGPQTIPDPFKGPHFVCRMLQNSPPTRFGTFYEAELRQSHSVSVYLNANALRFETDEAGSAVRELAVATLSGTRLAIKARQYVLATGGIENPRLLLASGAPGGNGIGNDHDLVGRFFMVHLVYAAGSAAVADPYTSFEFYTNETANGRLFEPFDRKFVSFVGLSEESMRGLRLPNARFMWSYEYGPAIKTVEALRRLVHGGGSGGIFADLRAVMTDLGGAGGFIFRKALDRQAIPVLGLRLHCSSEQIPDPESRIRLDDELDPLGMRRVAVDWKLGDENRRKAAAIQLLLGSEMGRAGFGRLRASMSGDDPAWPGDLYGDEHHIGTTRMHADPRQGVVDANCKIHGNANLYVAGSSVFPTAGAANPTLTICALALRLADHLKEKLA